MERFSPTALTAWRQRHGLSMAQLGVMIGIERVQIWRWENSETEPRACSPRGPALLLLELLMSNEALFERLKGQAPTLRRYHERKRGDTPWG